MNNRKLMAFPYYGGKFSHLDFILPYLPNDANHYVEVFGGSAAVLLNRKPVSLETYNDLYSDVCNFFKVLREKYDKLIGLLKYTPYSREEYVNACVVGGDDVEQARRFYIRACQSSLGNVQTATIGRWGHSIKLKKSPADTWAEKISMLDRIVERFLHVQIENKPALDIIRQYDFLDTVFYLDPPYAHGSRVDKKAYLHEMTDEDHVDLANTLNRIRGRAVVSGWRSDLYDDIYSGWHRVDGRMKVLPSSGNNVQKRESLWMNFDPPAGLGAKQLDMFDIEQNDLAS